jgi:NifU-like protein involved in Fe-S cluster formation
MSGQEIYDWSENCFDFYSETAVRHFMNPVNTGRLEEADGRGCTTSSSIEDFLEISIKVDAGTERIEEARFRAVGSPAAMACCSVLTELIERRSLGEIEAITAEDVEQALGGLPARKQYCAELSMVALKAAIEDYRQRQAFRDARQRNEATVQ